MANITEMEYFCIGRGRTDGNRVLVCITLVVSVIGSVGNVLSVKVFSSKAFASPKTTFLIYLAVIDIITLGLSNLVNIPFILDPESDLQDLLPLIPYVYIITECMIILELYVTVVIAIQRLICVVLPLKASVFITKTTNRVLLAILIFICMCLTATYLAEIRHNTWSPVRNRTMLVSTAPFTREQAYVAFSYFRLFGIRMSIPIIAITICSVIIAFKMNRKDKIFRTTARCVQRQRLTILCLIISAISVLTNMFATLVFLLLFFNVLPKCGLIEITLNLFININMSVNFIVYGFSGKKFRKAAKNVCSCVKRSRSAQACPLGTVWYSPRYDDINSRL